MFLLLKFKQNTNIDLPLRKTTIRKTLTKQIDCLISTFNNYLKISTQKTIQAFFFLLGGYNKTPIVVRSDHDNAANLFIF